MLRESGELSPALELYEKVLDREPKNHLALHGCGVALYRRGDFEKAVARLEQAVVLRPSDPTRHIDLGEVYRKLGDYRNSVGCCQVALKLRPNAPEALNTLGLALQGAGDLAGALDHFRAALAVRPDFFAAHTNAGQLLESLGEGEAALAHFRVAVELAPESSLARTNLGLALLGRDLAAESLIHFREAARIDPGTAVAHHNLGNALRILGSGEEARTSYLKAIRLDPDIAISYAQIAMTLRTEGLLGEALRWLKLAIELEPGNARFWDELAELHLKREEPDLAVECRRRVFELAPQDDVETRIALGWAMQEDGNIPEALEQYIFAHQIRPGLPQVQLAMSGAYEELGELSAAEAALREAIRLHPRLTAAHARLATLLRGNLPDADLETIEQILMDEILNRHQRDRLLFGLAHVLDARGEYTRAAACLSEANASTLQSRRDDGLHYEPENHASFANGLIGAFDGEFFRRTAGLGLGTRRPIFVVGLPRSGTTLVEQILASHPRVHGAGERLFGRRSFESVSPVVDRGVPPMKCVASLDEYALKRIAGEHLGKLNALDLGRAERIVEKLPENYLYMGFLVALFPNATFVHCRRDLRDVAVSCWSSDFRSIRWANDTGHIGARFRQYRCLMRHWSHVFPSPIVEVDYEDTVSDLEGVARRLLDACGLRWDPACLEFHRTKRVVRTASLTQVRRPIYKSSVARWKNYESDLAGLFASLTELAE